MTELKIGDKAPEFSVQISGDRNLTLGELKGKFVILYFYPKDNTPGCTIEANDFNSHLPEFQSLGAEILGISRDSLKAHDKFCSKYDLNIILGSDPEGKACEKYGAWVEKSMFGKKYMGINRATFLINPEGKIVHIWPKVSVMGHAKDVLNKLEEFSIQ